MIIVVFKFPNGIEVIISENLENKKKKTDTIGLLASSGSNNQGKILGLAHLLEHCLFLVIFLLMLFILLGK